MQQQKNASLAEYTSFHCGGATETLLICETPQEIASALAVAEGKLWILGYGTNVLISDKGLPGTTIICRGGTVTFDDTTIIADAGIWWDEVVEQSLAQSLWGLELMSGIPSSVGGAIVGNIAAYGQQISDHLEWVEVLDTKTRETKKLTAQDLSFGYRSSNLQNQNALVILRAAFNLSSKPTADLAYGSAVRVADELGLDKNSLEDRRKIILEARERAGSLYHHLKGEGQSATAGSFFKNPLVDPELAEKIVAFDETGKAAKVLMDMNRLHGGDAARVSAAHVLLAAGFKRGQSWGNVRLHPDHILKIENTGDALAQEIHDVASEIMATVQTKLGVTLEPEVNYLGEFNG